MGNAPELAISFFEFRGTFPQFTDEPLHLFTCGLLINILGRAMGAGILEWLRCVKYSFTHKDLTKLEALLIGGCCN